jgi:hypothetical protein
VSSSDPTDVQPWLRLESGESIAFLQPDEATALRDELQASDDDPASARLAAQIAVAVTVLTASPLHAGTRAVRISKDERGVLLEAARRLEGMEGDRFAKLREAFKDSE